MKNSDIDKIDSLKKSINNLDGRIIILDNKQVGSIKEKIEPSLEEKLKIGQTDESAKKYAELDEFKKGNIPSDEKKYNEMLDMYAIEIIEKLFKEI